MMADSQQEIINQFTHHLDDTRDLPDDIAQIFDNADTIEALREILRLFSELYHAPDKDIGSTRQALVNAAVELAHQVMSEGITYQA